ncbi:hypothetical protein EVAR_34097_1 [Eumeta japonica]|uniref:Uncharacterized protein n=1 Tax=Eumeta variegata TaxID=151549 RepID=A0A4C1WJA1_EUMVA|nr:hypothetical protein EVAR_34097_1 [Eumeta japonica]
MDDRIVAHRRVDVSRTSNESFTLMTASSETHGVIFSTTQFHEGYGIWWALVRRMTAPRRRLLPQQHKCMVPLNMWSKLGLTTPHAPVGSFVQLQRNFQERCTSLPEL